MKISENAFLTDYNFLGHHRISVLDSLLFCCEEMSFYRIARKLVWMQQKIHKLRAFIR